MVESPVRIENRTQLISVLSEAAELEHGISCCYLFAAFSMKSGPHENISADQLEAVGRWKREFIDVGIQEMLHLALVSNLLTAIGAAPHFGRSDLPTSPLMYPPSFQLALNRFSEETLSRFIFIERPEGVSPDQSGGVGSDGSSYRRSRSSDIFPGHLDYETVGHLYRGIEDGFRYLTEKHGEDGLFVGFPGSQTIDYPKLPDLVSVTDLSSAIQAIEKIVSQGEGASGDIEDSHYRRFLAIQGEYEQIKRHDPSFDPARPVMSNPYTHIPRSMISAQEVNIVDDPFSAAACNLFEGCYEVLVQMLARLFAHTDESKSELLSLADATTELMARVIGPLGNLVTTLPAGPSHLGLNSGPSFRLSRDVNKLPHGHAALVLFRERLRELAAYCGILNIYSRARGTLVEISSAIEQLVMKLPQTSGKPQSASFRSDPVATEPLIKVQPNGPYEIHGNIPLVRKSLVMSEHGDPLSWRNGPVLPSGERYLLCRCGHSRNKPFCDSSHTRVGFDGSEAPNPGPIIERQMIYEGVRIVMKDDRLLCSHRAFCGNNITDVWEMIGSTDDPQVRAQIMAMIGQCPSGALSYTVEPNGENVEPDLPKQINVTPNGPLWVSGGIGIERSDGQAVETRNRMTLCRCGGSKNKPFCDGSHRDVGFSDE